MSMLHGFENRIVCAFFAGLAFAFPSGSRADPPEGIYVRIIPLASPFKSKGGHAVWVQQDYTAQRVLRLIEDLKPDVLERFVTGKQDPDYLVPVDPGQPAMTVREFLNASMRAGAPGCVIMPKINLKWSRDTMISAAENLISLPVTPAIRILNLDNWNDYMTNHEPPEAKALFSELQGMGWQDIGLNMAGGYKDAFGYVSFADFLIDKKNWSIRTSTLDKLKRDPAIRRRFLYIDYPGQMLEFCQLPPDRQADVLTKVIGPAQREHGFTFVYPILQDFWDSTKVFTSKTGPYGGVSIYEVMKGMIEEDRASARRRRDNRLPEKTNRDREAPPADTPDDGAKP